MTDPKLLNCVVYQKSDYSSRYDRFLKLCDILMDSKTLEKTSLSPLCWKDRSMHAFFPQNRKYIILYTYGILLLINI